jgi:hypothetical protein
MASKPTLFEYLLIIFLLGLIVNIIYKMYKKEQFEEMIEEGFQHHEIEEFEGEDIETFEGDEIEGFEDQRLEQFQDYDVETFEGDEIEGFEGEDVETFEGDEIEGFEGDEIEGFKGSVKGETELDLANKSMKKQMKEMKSNKEYRPVDLANNKVSSYVTEYVDVARFKNPEMPKMDTDEKINAFRSSFFDFRNHIATSSKDTVDAVDKVNVTSQETLNGKSIGDVFDYFTKNQKNSADFITLSMIEKREGGQKGQHYIKGQNNAVFPSDSMLNGGKWMGEIEPVERSNFFAAL